MTKISALPAVTTLATTDEFAVNQGGVSKKATVDQVKTAVGATVRVATADQAESAGGATAVTGLGMTGFGNGTYSVSGKILWKSAASGTGIQTFFNLAGSGSVSVYATFWAVTTGTTAATGTPQTSQFIGNNTGLVEAKNQNANNSGNGGWVGAQNANAPALIHIEGLFIVSGGGTRSLDLQFASETGGGTAVTVMAGSMLKVEKVA